MVPHLVPEIEGGYPERDGEEEEEGGEGLVLENSRSWIDKYLKKKNPQTLKINWHLGCGCGDGVIDDLLSANRLANILILFTTWIFFLSLGILV